MRVLLVGALLCAASTSYAQSAEARALALFNEGMTALQEFRFSEARSLFEESLREYVEPGAAFNLGLAHRGAGDSMAAIEQWTRLLNGQYGDLDDAQRTQVESLVREEREALAHLEVRLGAHSETVELRIRIDGEEQDAIETGRRNFYVLNPGRHVLTGRAAGFETVEERVELARGERSSLDLTLTALPVTRVRVWQRAWFWTLLGVVVLAGVATAVGFATGPHYRNVDGVAPLGVVETP